MMVKLNSSISILILSLIFPFISVPAEVGETSNPKSDHEKEFLSDFMDLMKILKKWTELIETYNEYELRGMAKELKEEKEKLDEMLMERKVGQEVYENAKKIYEERKKIFDEYFGMKAKSGLEKLALANYGKRFEKIVNELDGKRRMAKAKALKKLRKLDKKMGRRSKKDELELELMLMDTLDMKEPKIFGRILAMKRKILKNKWRKKEEEILKEKERMEEEERKKMEMEGKDEKKMEGNGVKINEEFRKKLDENEMKKEDDKMETEAKKEDDDGGNGTNGVEEEKEDEFWTFEEWEEEEDEIEELEKEELERKKKEKGKMELKKQSSEKITKESSGKNDDGLNYDEEELKEIHGLMMEIFGEWKCKEYSNYWSGLADWKLKNIGNLENLKTFKKEYEKSCFAWEKISKWFFGYTTILLHFKGNLAEMVRLASTKVHSKGIDVEEKLMAKFNIRPFIGVKENLEGKMNQILYNFVNAHKNYGFEYEEEKVDKKKEELEKKIEEWKEIHRKLENLPIKNGILTKYREKGNVFKFEGKYYRYREDFDKESRSKFLMKWKAALLNWEVIFGKKEIIGCEVKEIDGKEFRKNEDFQKNYELLAEWKKYLAKLEEENGGSKKRWKIWGSKKKEESGNGGPTKEQRIGRIEYVRKIVKELEEKISKSKHEDLLKFDNGKYKKEKMKGQTRIGGVMKK